MVLRRTPSSAVVGGGPRTGNYERLVMIAVKGPASLRHRMRVAASEEGMTYAELMSALLDLRDGMRTRKRAAQRHPLDNVVLA